MSAQESSVSSELSGWWMPHVSQPSPPSTPSWMGPAGSAHTLCDMSSRDDQAAQIGDCRDNRG